MVREGVRQVERALHDRVVGVADPVWCQLRRQVGDAQQELAHLLLDLGQVGGERRLGITHGPALGRDQVRLVGVARAAQLPDLLRELVHPAAGVVALGGEGANPLVERRHFVELDEDLR